MLDDIALRPIHAPCKLIRSIPFGKHPGQCPCIRVGTVFETTFALLLLEVMRRMKSIKVSLLASDMGRASVSCPL